MATPAHPAGPPVQQLDRKYSASQPNFFATSVPTHQEEVRANQISRILKKGFKDTDKIINFIQETLKKGGEGKAFETLQKCKETQEINPFNKAIKPGDDEILEVLKKAEKCFRKHMGDKENILEGLGGLLETKPAEKNGPEV